MKTIKLLAVAFAMLFVTSVNSNVINIDDINIQDSSDAPVVMLPTAPYIEDIDPVTDAEVLQIYLLSFETLAILFQNADVLSFALEYPESYAIIRKMMFSITEITLSKEIAVHYLPYFRAANNLPKEVVDLVSKKYYVDSCDPADEACVSYGDFTDEERSYFGTPAFMRTYILLDDFVKNVDGIYLQKIQVAILPLVEELVDVINGLLEKQKELEEAKEQKKTQVKYDENII